jgi:hypothetical protein
MADAGAPEQAGSAEKGGISVQPGRFSAPFQHRVSAVALLAAFARQRWLRPWPG